MKDYCRANEIHLSHSGPYMHESNGKAERIWRTLTEMAQTYLLTAQLPLKFWTFAIEHAVFVRNRMPHKALDWKTPYELWYGRKPNLSSIRVFGCLAYYYVDANMRKKLEPRGVPTVYVGQAENSNSYKLWNLRTNLLVESGMVRFIERLDTSGRLVSVTERDKLTEDTYKELFEEAESSAGGSADSHRPKKRARMNSEQQQSQMEAEQAEPEIGNSTETAVTNIEWNKIDKAETVPDFKALLDIGQAVDGKGIFVAVCKVQLATSSETDKRLKNIGSKWVLLSSLIQTQKRNTDTTLYRTIQNRLKHKNLHFRKKIEKDLLCPLFSTIMVNYSEPVDNSGGRTPVIRLAAIAVAYDPSQTTNNIKVSFFTAEDTAWISSHEIHESSVADASATTESGQVRSPVADKVGRLYSLISSGFLLRPNQSRVSVDWMIDPSQFAIYQNMFHHDVDACCNQSGGNSLLPHFWSDAFNQVWTGLNVWCNPPFHRIKEFLFKFLQERDGGMDPDSTTATFVVPYCPDASWWPILLANFDVVHTYPAGTKLFTGPHPTTLTARKDWGPTRVPIWVLRSKTSEYLSTGYDHAEEVRLSKLAHVLRDCGGEMSNEDWKDVSRLNEQHAESSGDTAKINLLTESVNLLKKAAGLPTEPRPSVSGCVHSFMADSGDDPIGLFGGCNPFASKLPFGHVKHAFVLKDAVGNIIPKTLRIALTLPDAKEWLACWQNELNALLKYNIGILVAAPRYHKVLKSRIVFKIKYGPDGSILKYKARFVACGYSQSYGLDYLETFAPVVQLPALRLMLALCVNLGLKTFHIDFENAFLQADLSETIYVKLPEGAEQFDKDGRPLVMKLKKSLYGLKQSPHNWNAKLVAWLIKEDFEQSTYC